MNRRNVQRPIELEIISEFLGGQPRMPLFHGLSLPPYCQGMCPIFVQIIM